MKLDQEKCFVCGLNIPFAGQPNATYHAVLRGRFCQSKSCERIVRDNERDCSQSIRGRFLGRKEALARIAAAFSATNSKSAKNI